MHNGSISGTKEQKNKRTFIFWEGSNAASSFWGARMWLILSLSTFSLVSFLNHFAFIANRVARVLIIKITMWRFTFHFLYLSLVVLSSTALEVDNENSKNHSTRELSKQFTIFSKFACLNFPIQFICRVSQLYFLYKDHNYGEELHDSSPLYQADDDDLDNSTSFSKSLEFEKALNSPTISPTTSCKDDWTFRFEIDSGKKRGCFWLKKNNAVERQKKWCSRKHIMTGCKSTCGFCDCKESEFFFFEKNMGNPAACKWLREKEIRRERYCYIGRHSNYDTAPVSSIAMNCPISCKLCQADEEPDEARLATNPFHLLEIYD